MKRSHRFADHRALGFALTLTLILGGGAWLARLPAPHGPAESAAEAGARTLQQQFDEAVMLLHGRRYAAAEAALRQVLALAPGLPEAHVNLGFSLLGLHRTADARRAFETAINLRPEQANAYFGLALSHESV
ncbi:MAG: tetratricopeptide repeat protein, partial [Hydrogenophaga sp.]|nr:tetratricopeptide repeat protein [Hydrogenophaga sp.]